MCECILCLLDEVYHFEWREMVQMYEDFRTVFERLRIILSR